MSNAQENFRQSMKELLQLFVTAVPSYKEVNDLYGVCDSLDMKKIAKRYLTNMVPHLQDIADGKDEMFYTNLKPFPKFYVKKVWPLLSPNQRGKALVLFRLLIVLGQMVMNDEEELDVFAGVGDDNKDYGINDMFTGEQMDYSDFKPDMGKLVNMLGLDKYFGDISKIGEELKNISDDDIEKASSQIKKMMGQDTDTGTQDLISTILSDIKKELGTTDLSKGDVITNMMNIAESVSNRVRPTVNSKQRENLAASMENLTKNFGKEMGVDPKDIPDPEQMMKNAGIDPDNLDEDMSEADAAKLMGSMMANMNMGKK